MSFGKRSQIKGEKIMKQKIKPTMMALILIISVFTSLALLPTDAHTPPANIPSFAKIVAAPNPIGVGQTTYITMWVDTNLPSAEISNTIRRMNYKLTITDPDGQVQTMSWPIIEDTTGIQFTSYTPTKVGTYNLTLDYAGQKFTWGANEPNIGNAAVYQNDTFLPATRSITLTVQQEKIPSPIDSYPLPTEYWTRPIEAENTYWFSISSNWLGQPYITNRLQIQGIAPNSSHIMWTKSLDTGGVVGGTYGDLQGEGFYIGRSYNQRFDNPIVMYGILYYQLPDGNAGYGGGTIAVDLRTGKQVWFNQDIGAFQTTNWARGGVNPILPAISFGYYYDINDRNQHGVDPQGVLFSSNFAIGYNPLTGKIQYNVTGVPSGTQSVGPHGEIVRYVFDSTTKKLALWNFSRLFTYEYQASEGGQIPAFGTVINGTYHGQYNVSNLAGIKNPTVYFPPYYDGTAWSWNVTLSQLPSGSWSIVSFSRAFDSAVDNDNIMLLSKGNLGARDSYAGIDIAAVSLKPDSRGSILWTKHYEPAPNNDSRSFMAWDPKAGVFVTYDQYSTQRDGFSLADGSHLWTIPGTTQNDFAYFDWFFPGFSAYGNLYYSGYSGIMFCWDIKTGNLKWTYGNGGVPGNSTYDVQQSWGLRPLMIQAIADGKIYASGDEHSPNTPLYKDDLVRCINATTGEEIWTMLGWIPGSGGGGSPNQSFVADGYFGYLNAYTMQVTVVGKGPSTMTIEAPKSAVRLGDSLVITGNVMDTAAGTTQDEQIARFPNGVPAVSDASMANWMEYVYMQKPRPTDTVGVPVTISVIDANGNYRQIGQVISDADGFYSLNWKPDIEGKYTVYASFAGSESYWPSHAVTAFAVDPAPPTSTPEPIQPSSIADLYFIPAIAGLFVFIAIIGVVIILVLRKRP